MRVVVVGTGYVGLVTGVCLARVGNEVICIDKDAAKIERLQSGQIPIFEPGLDALVRETVETGCLTFGTNLGLALRTAADFVFIAVGTPPGEDGSADLSHVVSVAEEIGQYLTYPTVIVDKSTVPVGTADKVRAAIGAAMARRGAAVAFDVASNPEFLKEGAAIADFMRPARVIIGTDSSKASAALSTLYAPFTRNHERLLVMGVRDAEMTKYAANAMLATRISFMNEMAVLCEKLGVDVENVRAGIGSDPRIGSDFLYAGVGYGGSCFPKDVKALIRTGRDSGVTMGILESVEARNESQKHHLTKKISARYGHDIAGKHFALWGLAFKAGTDDMREAASHELIRDLLTAGAFVTAFDPVAARTARAAFPKEWLGSGRLSIVDSADACLSGGVDALVVITEWMQFRSPNWTLLAQKLKDRVVFDGRNLYKKEEVTRSGLDYVGIGR
ncbi:UDP-glucose/GDP-mannose dehydrogenase family protein [Paraburkholderia sp. UCT31]|uniref:UDP-glucose dehydrogenase family protein n=1 Tax=Paraburkholderia sp. UCT31 TaxID=2615209 RepID=UPI001655D08B|nr:UDP-glucose/GDP-mannose dehydrogenase family protein [Paraburkholderia sp. UCT31]MBC8738490.1 UDP-glucose/GDP-mannose dehydrogenase family protein [Paraburkholderia sp. UCT31]